MHPILNTCWLEDIMPLHKRFKSHGLNIIDYLGKVILMLNKFEGAEDHTTIDAIIVVGDLEKNYKKLSKKYGEYISF